MSAAAPLTITGSRQLPSWMAEHNLSLACTTYQAGKLFLLGLQPDGRLSVFERTFNRCMGLCATDQTLWMSSLYQLWRFENALPSGRVHQGYDRLYVPRLSYITGDLDVHDIGLDSDGRLIFVNTLFSCLATTSETHSFVPVWQPPFISRLAAEDRCHLNGMAMKDGKPAAVTAVSRSDVADGWRDFRRGGGVVLSVPSGDVLAAGLSMPHSPRYHNGRLWLLEAGSGHLGFIDNNGNFERVTFLPGFARGLAFVGDYALIGVSGLRRDRTFGDLELGERLAEKQATARCGLQIVDLRTGDVVHWLRFEGLVKELYDVAVLPGVKRPMALGFKTDEIRRTITIGE